jgi:hypothetical protein
MSNFIEFTGYKGEKLIVNTGTIKTVAEFSVPVEDMPHVEDKRIFNAKAIVSTEDGTIPVTDTYADITARLFALARLAAA